MLVILKHGNMFYVIGSVLLFYSWPILQFVNLACHGWWAVEREGESHQKVSHRCQEFQRVDEQQLATRV